MIDARLQLRQSIKEPRSMIIGPKMLQKTPDFQRSRVFSWQGQKDSNRLGSVLFAVIVAVFGLFCHIFGTICAA
jgi:hypothetical protein